MLLIAATNARRNASSALKLSITCGSCCSSVDFPRGLGDLFAKTETIEQSHQLHAQRSWFAFTRHGVKQFGKSLDDERGPRERRRMNVARRTSLLLDAFLFELDGFSVLDVVGDVRVAIVRARIDVQKSLWSRRRREVR